MTRLIVALCSLAAALAAPGAELQFTTASVSVSKGRDASKGTEHTAEHPAAMRDMPAAGAKEFLTVAFPVRSSQEPKKKIAPHQSFVRLQHVETGLSTFYVASAEEEGGELVAQLDLALEKETLLGRSGAYVVELVVGDAAFATGAKWKLGEVELSLGGGGGAAADVPLYHRPLLHESDTTLEALPEITHVFREPDSRPPTVVSLATAGGVAALFAGLVVSLLARGANLSNLPGGSGFLAAAAFHGCLGLILALFGVYWLRLDMFTTLGYLAPLAVATVVFGHQNLRNVATAAAKKSS